MRRWKPCRLPTRRGAHCSTPPCLPPTVFALHADEHYQPVVLLLLAGAACLSGAPSLYLLSLLAPAAVYGLAAPGPEFMLQHEMH